VTAVPVVACQQQQIDLLLDREINQLHKGSARGVSYFVTLLAGTCAQSSEWAV
jgi:hypothetical protein